MERILSIWLSHKINKVLLLIHILDMISDGDWKDFVLFLFKTNDWYHLILKFCLGFFGYVQTLNYKKVIGQVFWMHQSQEHLPNVPSSLFTVPILTAQVWLCPGMINCKKKTFLTADMSFYRQSFDLLIIHSLI